ncbi:MAG: FadR family transcriptional regulator, partial [Burkholderiaceae bacterium]
MPLQFQPVASGARLADQVADALATEIRSGRLEPGARLPTEAVLASQFAVSRTVVREAVSRLKSLGLVDSRQGSGV